MTLLFRRNIMKLKMLKLAGDIQKLDNFFVVSQFNLVYHTHIDRKYNKDYYKIDCGKICDTFDNIDERTLNKCEEVARWF